MLAVREITSVRVWSRNENKRREFAEDCSDIYRRPVEAVDTAEAAVRDADIVITATFAGEPVLHQDWVKPGAHVNAVGSNNPRRRELPGELIAQAGRLVVDSIDQCRLEAGDLLLALDEAGWGRVESSNVVAGGEAVSPATDGLLKSVALV